jgi:hypothetical protein
MARKEIRMEELMEVLYQSHRGRNISQIKRSLEHSSFLPAIARSIVLTNPSGAFGNNTLMQPKNNPNTSGDAIMKAWEDKNKSQDRSMQKWSNAMRGYEPTFDPVTGQRYTAPL